MFDAKKHFDEAVGIADPVARSQALGDLCFDAESFAKNGDTATAIVLFELLSTLDRNDDLLLPYVQSAEEHLIQLGKRKQQSLEDVVRNLQDRFAALSDYDRNMAIAKTLVRDFPRRQKAITLAREFVTMAADVQSLTRKDQRFNAELDRYGT